jgi:hypothetical protein
MPLKIIAKIVLLLSSIGVAQNSMADDITGIDKLSHFATSATISSITTRTHPGITGIAIAIAPGIAKELSDMSGAGTPSFKDMAANLVGVLVGAIIPHKYIITPIAPHGAIDGVSIAYVTDL